MQANLLHAMTVFMGFFAIMNPIANVPIFLGLTSDDDAQTTAAVALRSVIVAFFIVAVFAVAGKLIFAMFGLTLPAFRIAGGLLVFGVGFQMLHGKQSKVQHAKEVDPTKAHEAALSVAISPLAMPILAGPGTIATAMSFSSGGGITELILTIVMFGVLCAITYLLFRFGGKFVHFIGPNALGVITRMMGLILTVIGVQMVVEGVQGAFGLTA